MVVPCCIALLVTPCHAQTREDPLTPQAAFETFLRVAEFTGRATTVLPTSWPESLRLGGSSGVLLTAAHRLSLGIRDTRTPSEVPMVSDVTFMEYVPDTVALRQRITEVVQQLQTKYGAPDRCTTPFGPPSYLFNPQTVERVWSKGIASLPTRLEWWRTADAKLGFTIVVASTPVDDSNLLPCAARIP